ncbi:MAG: hypothetical protein DRJ42_29555 [Deltaproteobacteria bacterium]|nr:MAG: hypothetical protein DRJ42_29555 [Deltaproteobacteria bacterium]
MVKKLAMISTLTVLACSFGGCGDSDDGATPYCGNGVVDPGEECDGTPDCTVLCTIETGPPAQSLSRDLFCLLGEATIDPMTGLPVTDPMGQTNGGTILGVLPVRLSVNPDADFSAGTAVGLIVAFDAIIPQEMSANFIVPAYSADTTNNPDPVTDPIVLGDVSARVSVNGTPMTIDVERLTTDDNMDMIPDDGTDLYFAVDDPANPGTPLPVEVPFGPFTGSASVTLDGASPTADFLVEGISLDLAAVPLIQSLNMGSRLDPAMPNADFVVDCIFLDQYPVGSASPEYLTFDVR